MYITESVAEVVRMCGSFLTIRDDIVYIIHQSVKDFLSADTSLFPFGIEERHYTMFLKSLLTMSNILRRDVYRLHVPELAIDQINKPDPDPLAWVKYSCIHWIDHLSDCSSYVHAIEDLQDGGRVNSFLGESYLNWLEALSLLRGMSEGIRSMAKLEGLLQVSLDQ
jgi:hypothetical protein